MEHESQGVIPTVINLPVEVKKALVDKAKERGQSIKDFVVEALEEKILKK